MFPVIGLVLGGVAATAFLRRGRRCRPVLLDSLAEPGVSLPHPKQGTTGQTRSPGIMGTAIACIERWDGRYQSLIQTHLDPLIMGRLRTEQMQHASVPLDFRPLYPEIKPLHRHQYGPGLLETPAALASLGPNVPQCPGDGFSCCRSI